MRRAVTSWILAVVCVSSAWAVEPANRKSNPQVKAVLEYFYSLSGKTDNRIVSGQFVLSAAKELATRGFFGSASEQRLRASGPR